MKPMKTLLKISMMSMWLAGFAAVASAADSKIVVIDLNRAFNEYYKTPIADAKLKENAAAFNKERDEMIASFSKLNEQLKTLREEAERPELSPEARQERQKAIEAKLAELQRAQAEIQEYERTHANILRDQHQRMRQTIVKEIYDVIQQEARINGYTLILDKSGRTHNNEPAVLFNTEAIEITDDIVKILNRGRPRTLETPSTAPAAPQR
jgi:outer membrane protein